MAIVLAGGLLLTISAYYLGEKAQVSAFPTYLCGLVWLALCCFPGRITQLRANPIIVLSSVLIFYLAFTTAWSDAASVKTTLLYIGFALLLMGFVAGVPFAARSWGGFLSWLVTVTILAGAVSALYSLYFYYGLDYHPPLSFGRLYALGRLSNPAVSAFSYSVPLIFAAYRLFHRPAVNERIIWGMTTLILGYTLYLTDTRSTWVGLVAAGFAMVIFSTRLRPRQRILTAVGVSAVIGAGIFGLLHSAWREELLKRSTSFRPEIWSATLHKMSGINWLVGHGNNVSSAVHDGRYTFDHPHSIYLSTLFYGGAIGLTLLLLLIATSYLVLLRQRASELRGLALASLTFGVVSLVFDGDYLLDKIDFTWIVLWLPIAMAACLISRRGFAPE